MNLTARLLLDTSGFIRPAENALGPLRKVKTELGEVGREAGRVASRQSAGGSLALPAAAGMGGVAAGVAPAIVALASVRAQTMAVAQEMRRTAAPVAELRGQFRSLSLDAGGGGGRRMINVTPFAAMRSEIVLARTELARYVALQQLALGGGTGQADGGGYRTMVYAPVGRLLQNGKWVTGGGAGAAAGGGALGGVGGGLLKAALPLAGTAAFIGGGMASISAASQMEDYQTSFSTLLGGMDAAQRRMKELAQFAQTTPFELPEVAQASRVLETLTRGALSTGDGLRLVGDVAANTGQNFGELAMWIGRMYDGLQSGRPVGEALMRLQELGVVSGDVRSRIEALQQEGKRGAEVWGVAASAFARFSGEMERRSATLSGRVSNLKDSFSALAREIGEPLSAMAKEPVTKVSHIVTTFTKYVANVKEWYKDALGVVPEGAFPGPAEAPAAAPKPAATEQELEGEIRGFFAPLDRIAQARASIRDMMASMAGLRSQAVLQDPFASDADRERALMDQARRAWKESGLKGDQVAPGIWTDPQTADEALKRVDARMRELEAMREVNEFVHLTAQEMERLNAAYEKLVPIANQLRGLRNSAVDRALGDFFGPLDAKQRGGAATYSRPPTDNLARIGLFVGAGGPANDHARRTAAGVEQLVRISERNAAIDRGVKARSAAIDAGLAARQVPWQ